MTELKKPVCHAFHSYDDADIGITKLSVQSSLKCLVTEISETKDLLVLLLHHADKNHCTLKVTKKENKVVPHNIFHHKTILGSNIYAKIIFLHALTGCDTSSSINGARKATDFKNFVSNKHLQEAALVFTARSKSHKDR